MQGLCWIHGNTSNLAPQPLTETAICHCGTDTDNHGLCDLSKFLDVAAAANNVYPSSLAADVIERDREVRAELQKLDNRSNKSSPHLNTISSLTTITKTHYIILVNSFVVQQLLISPCIINHHVA
jgi:hypothetical protein